MGFIKRSILSWFTRPVPEAGPSYTQAKPVVENLEDRLVPATLPSLEHLMAQSGTLTILSPDVAQQVPIEEYADSQVLTLDASHDVVDQISDYLGRQSSASIGVVRIIGHGSDGTLLLGDQLFNQQTLSKRASQISGWKRAFTPGADMLVYGCSVASTTDGRTFVDTLGRLTGTDVAASTNLTGSTTLGGDLALEYATGKIQAKSGNFAQAWNASGLTLATLTVSNTSDSGAGSLRQAIIDANNESINPGADTILFAAGLTAGGPAIINLSTSGDGTAGPSAFGITSPITITGPTGSNGITLSNTFVNQRLFYVSAAGKLTLDSLTLSDGKAQGGNGFDGGGGAAGLGGAIFNAGSLTILNSTLSGNQAIGGGGSSMGSSGGGGGGLGGSGSRIDGGGPNGGGAGYFGGDGATSGGFGGGGGGGNGDPSGSGIPGHGGFGGGGGGGGAEGVGGFGGGSGNGAVYNGGFGGSGGNGAIGGFGGGGAGLGGAIFNNAGTVVISNSTFNGNTAEGGEGGGHRWPRSGRSRFLTQWFAHPDQQHHER